MSARARLACSAFAIALLAGCATTSPEPASRPPGDLRLTYRLPQAGGEEIPYRLYVPSNWNPRHRWPLVVLFGYGGSVDRAFSDAHGELEREAEKHGFVIAAPNGYHGTADYGANLTLPAALSPTGKPIRMGSPEESALAQADVQNVIDRAVAEYRIDPQRIYLVGNSMGMVGALHFADAFAGKWCGLSASAGPPWPDYPVEKLKALKGARFFIGDSDDTAKRADVQRLVDRARAIGVPVDFHVVAGGTHTGAWVWDLPQAFDFFATLDCGKRPGSER